MSAQTRRTDRYAMHAETRKTFSRSRLKTYTALAGTLVMSGVLVVVWAVAASATPQPKIGYCHATNSNSNPYVYHESDASSILSGAHGDDDPVYPATGSDGKWGDIIPAFDYNGGHYDGANWTAAGQAIFDAHCAVGDQSSSTTTQAGGGDSTTTTPQDPTTTTPPTGGGDSTTTTSQDPTTTTPPTGGGDSTTTTTPQDPTTTTPPTGGGDSTTTTPQDPTTTTPPTGGGDSTTTTPPTDGGDPTFTIPPGVGIDASSTTAPPIAGADQSTSPAPQSSAGGSSTGGGNDSPTVSSQALARTGSNSTAPLAVIGIGLVLLGTVMLATAKRRYRTS
jgi:hypothetical protein